jgi:hypothetical protein
MISKSLATGLLVFGASLASLGCNGAQSSGQTGSPFQEPPEYRSPGKFGPEEPGGGTGNPGGPSIDNNPIWRRLPSDLARLQGDLLLVFNAQRGLLVFDVTTADDPQLIGTLPMELGSYPYALRTEPNAATLVALEYSSVRSASLTDEPMATQTQRMIRVDLTDPTNPTRVADVALGGTFWGLQQQGNQFFALTQLYGEAELTCDEQGQPVYYVDQGPAWKHLQVTQFSFDGAAFTEVATAKLPSDGLGFITERGFAGIPNGYEAEHSLNWVGFDATAGLSALSSVDLPGQVLGVAARQDQVAVAVQTDQGGLLKLYDSSGAALEEVASLALTKVGPVLEFLPGMDKLALSGAAGSLLIDVSTPTAPVAEALPGTVQRLLATDAGLLGIGTTDGMPGSGAVFSLWEASTVTNSLTTLTTDWPLFGLDSNEYEIWSVQGSTLALPFQRQGDRTPALGVVEISDTGLTISGETRMHNHNPAPLLTGDPPTLAYGIGDTFVEVLPLSTTAPASVEASSVVHDLREPVIRQHTENATHELELRVLPDETREAVFTPKDGSEATVVELTHHADELIVAGDFVVVAGLHWNSECQYLDPANGEPIDGNPQCGPQNDRALSVFSADGTLIQTFPISTSMDLDDPIANAEAETNWDGYLRLSEDRLVFVVERIIRCNSQASCDALGVPAYTSYATPGGMSCADPDACPPVSNEPIEIVSGHKLEMLYYLLDLGGAEPRLLAPALGNGEVDLIGEGPLDTSARALPFPGGFALSGTEELYNEQGNSLTDANGEALQRFWLQRFLVDDDGVIEALPAVNTPGRAFAFHDDTLLSAEPVFRDGDRIATVHRSRVVNDGAFIEESVELGAGHISPMQIGDRAFVIQGPGDYCAATLESELFELDLSRAELSPNSVLTLPLANWSFDLSQPEAGSDVLYLRGGPLEYLGRLSLDVSQRGSPSIVQYESLNPQAALP